MYGKMWTPQEVKNAIRDYQAGMSIWTMCERYNRTERSIYSKLSEFGVGRKSEKREKAIKKKRTPKPPIEVYRTKLTPWPKDVKFEDHPDADKVGRRVFI